MTQWVRLAKCVGGCGVEAGEQCRDDDDEPVQTPCIGREVRVCRCRGCGAMVPAIGVRLIPGRSSWCSLACRRAWESAENAAVTSRLRSKHKRRA